MKRQRPIVPKKMPRYLTYTMLGALAALNQAHADSASRTGTTDSVWGTASNWGAAATPPLIDEVATFDGAGNGNTILDVAGQTVDSIIFDTASAAAYTIGTGAASSQMLSMNSSSGNRFITVESSVTTDQVFNADVIAFDNVGAIVVRNNAPGTTLTFNGNFQDKKFGNLGAVPGATIIMNGLDNKANNGSFKGGGTLTTNSHQNNKSFTAEWGTVNYSDSKTMTNLTVGHASAGNGDATFNLLGSNLLRINTSLSYRADDATANLGLVTGDAGSALNFNTAVINADDNPLVSGPELTINADISSVTDAVIAVDGAGTVEFNGLADHTQGFNITNGLFLFNGTGNSGPTTVSNPGALGGNGVTDGDVFIESDGGMTFDLITPPGSHDKLDVGGAFEIVDFADLKITASAAGATTGTYTLVTSVGAMTGTPADITVTLPSGWAANQPMISGNDLTIEVTSVAAPPASITWNAGTGNWDIAGTANWLGGDTFFHDGDTANFDEATSVGTVTLTENVAPQAVNITNTATPFVFDGAFSITTAGVFNVNAGLGTDVTVDSTLAGEGSLSKVGNGTLVLNGTNTFTGGITNASPSTDGSIVRVNNVDAAGSGDIVLNGTNARLQFGGVGGTFANNVTLSSIGNNKEVIFDLDGAGTAIELTGTVSLLKPQTYRSEFHTGDDLVTISGLVTGQGGLESTGGGTLTLNNDANDFGTHANGLPINVRGGILRFTSINDQADTNSALGQGDNFLLGAGGSTGTLEYIGAAAEESDRTFQFGNNTGLGSGRILVTGAGSLLLDAPAFNTPRNLDADLGLPRDLTLGGTNAGANEISGVIADNAGATDPANNAISVIKEGTGTWCLSGVNTYSGDTTVNEGTLCITNASSIPAGGDVYVDAAGGGDLNLDFGGTITIGKLFIDGAAVPVGMYGSSQDGLSGTGMLDVTETQSDVDPQITSITVSGGVATITITGGANTTYICTSSDDLVTAFEPIATTPATVTTDGNGDATFMVDASVTRRFYIVED